MLPVAIGNVSNAKIGMSEISVYTQQLINSSRLTPGDNIQINGNIISATDTIYDDAAVREQLEEVYTELGAELERISGRMESIENLGHYAGSFPDFASLPANAAAFPQGITANDFATIQADETNGGQVTRYVVSGIAPDGAITWAYNLTYSTDISGKQDRLTAGSNIQISSDNTISATDTIPSNAQITLQKNGAAVDSFSLNQPSNKAINLALGKSDVGLGDVDNTSDASKPISYAVQNALDSKALNWQTLFSTSNTDMDVSTLSYQNSISQILQTIWNKIRSVTNMLAKKAWQSEEYVDFGDTATVSGYRKFIYWRIFNGGSCLTIDSSNYFIGDIVFLYVIKNNNSIPFTSYLRIKTGSDFYNYKLPCTHPVLVCLIKIGNALVPIVYSNSNDYPLYP